jgi:ammonium transporter, Amt family
VIFARSGTPSPPYEGYATINLGGQVLCAVIMFVVLGFLPGWAWAKIRADLGVLLIPEEVELHGLDFHENKLTRL